MAVLQIVGPRIPGDELILGPEALNFIKTLAERFEAQRQHLLAQRVKKQASYDAGQLPDFDASTACIRSSDWQVATLPKPLQGRVVEITGPVDRKMIINGLNSGADVFMADFEDASCPNWKNMVQGQLNLFQAVRGSIEHPSENGKLYRLCEDPATLMVRPRGLHLDEAHVLVDGTAVSASLFDFGLFLFHNAHALLQSGIGPYLYLPKIEHYLEARWWNEVFVAAQQALKLPTATIKATVLIETLPAAFMMEEILYELRDHAAGLNCGRWDYIFSYIKTFRQHANRVVPDRAQVGMTQPFMHAYAQLLIQTCHRRGALAMGGMAAQIPIKSDPQANLLAMDKVAKDKAREARNGHDGTWVAHPALIPIARAAFRKYLRGPNQLHVALPEQKVERDDLLAHPIGDCTDAGLRTNVRVAIRYLEAWLHGTGCVPLDHLMEDAATAEISRSQVWQWLRHGICTTDGQSVTPQRLRTCIDEELVEIRNEVGETRFDDGRFDTARDIFLEVAARPTSFAAFLTEAAYPHVADAKAQQAP